MSANACPGLHLRMMSPADLEPVMAVERASYNHGWPPTAFERELRQNQMARYIVLAERDGRVAGFGGLWLMVDEAHIVTVAVLPADRGRGFGRLLVHGLVGLAMDSGMALATLEVRVSNEAARKLYGLYGFYEVGLRKRYYSDNQEDAVIMTTEALAGAPYQARLAGLRDDLSRLLPGAPQGL